MSVGDLDEYVAAGVVGARDVGSAGGAQPQQGVDRDLAVPGAAQRLAQPGEGGVIEQSPAAVDGHRRVRTEEPVGVSTPEGSLMDTSDPTRAARSTSG